MKSPSNRTKSREGGEKGNRSEIINENNSASEKAGIDMVDSKLADAEIEAADLNVDPVAACGEQWVKRFNELLEYKKQHGDCNVSFCDTPNKSLGKWVYKMRNEFKNGRLTKERVARLNDVGFAWSMPRGNRNLNPGMKKPGTPRANSAKYRASWAARYEELLEFKETHGHCNVPRRYELNKKLGVWVHMNRVKFKKEQLSVDRVAKLKDIGFVWRINKRTEWTSHYEDLIRYKEEHGHCNVPQDYKLNKALGEWVKNTRAYFRDGALSETRIAMLNELGFVWKSRTLVDWKTRFAELVEFKDQHGHCNVPMRDKDNKQLGKWVDRMRTEFKNGNLSDERIEMLNDVGFAWNIR